MSPHGDIIKVARQATRPQRPQRPQPPSLSQLHYFRALPSIRAKALSRTKISRGWCSSTAVFAREVENQDLWKAHAKSLSALVARSTSHRSTRHANMMILVI